MTLRRALSTESKVEEALLMPDAIDAIMALHPQNKLLIQKLEYVAFDNRVDRDCTKHDEPDLLAAVKFKD